jgi:uncharacterized protein YdeI (YjbR/CyaY-like superfamily)
MDRERIHFEDRKAWREWLTHNHQRPSGFWMLINKKGSKRRGVSYEEAVQEALCFGWIDSVVNRLDEDQFMQWFSPRRPGSVWSAKNIARAKAMIEAGLMTEAGMAKLPKDLADFKPDQSTIPEGSYIIPPELEDGLEKDPQARRNYDRLTKSDRKRYHLWINMAKRSETRERRVRETLELLRDGKVPGQK